MVKNSKKQLNDDVTFERNKRLQFEQAPETVPSTEKVQSSDQRIFYLAVVAILFSFAAVAFSGLNIKTSGHHAFVVVDINQLLRQKATEIVKKQTDATPETQNEIQLAEQARRIRSVIEAYARDNNVIVLIKGTVFGADVMEVTDEISTLL